MATQATYKYGSAKRWARALGWFSIGIGLTELLLHRRLGRLIGVRSRIAGAGAAVAGVAALDVVCTKKLAEREPSAIAETVQTVAVNRSPEECYQFWRDLENLPSFMKHLVSVRTTADGRTHWVAKGPAGMQVAWEAEVTEDQPNRISWRSLEGGDVENSGSVRFDPGPMGHGTIVKAHIQYRPPAGKFGSVVAKLFGEEPSIQAKTDLRRFKQMMETGEVATIEGQTSGRASFQRDARATAAHA